MARDTIEKLCDITHDTIRMKENEAGMNNDTRTHRSRQRTRVGPSCDEQGAVAPQGRVKVGSAGVRGRSGVVAAWVVPNLGYCLRIPNVEAFTLPRANCHISVV